MCPSTVGTSASKYATIISFQRKCFYANGRLWVFYSDGINIVFRTSTDGFTWTSPTTVRGAPHGYLFSIWFDGTYLHYAYTPSGMNAGIYYRRGIPNSDGMITWSATEQMALAPDPDYYISDPFVSVDSGGYPWIGYVGGMVADIHGWVTKSSTNDGTWVTADDFPYELAAGDYRTTPVPLTGGKMLAVYGNNGVTVKARRWDGSTWGTEVSTTSPIHIGNKYSAVAEGDEVHLIFLSTARNILYVKYTYFTNSWGSETTVQPAILDCAPVLSRDTISNDLYCFWAGTPTVNHIFYKKYDALTGTWDTDPIDWIDESVHGLVDNRQLTCFYQDYGYYIGLVYLTGSPYNVRFDFLTLLPVPQYTLSISSTIGGTTEPSPGDHIYDERTVVRVTAISDEGYQLDHWVFDGEDIEKADIVDVTMNADHTLQAVFVEIPLPPEYTLDIITMPGGTTSPAPGSYTHSENTTVQIIATPDAGYNFNHWILDGATRTENPISILMDRDYTLTAYFEAIPPPEYTLTIATTTGGNTDPSPGSYTHPEGTSVTVTAIPNSGYKFDHWIINGITRTENPITITMNTNYTLTAYFTELPPPEHTLTISTTTGGTTNPAPGSHNYVEGTTVKVTAIPDLDYNFDHWELDGVTYTSNPINVLMDTDHSLTAYFSEEAPPPPETYKLTVSSTIGGTTNPPSGVHEYDVGTTVTVTATPENGYYFNHWELDGVVRTENPITVTMDKDHTLMGVFSIEPPPPLPPFLGWILVPVIIGGIMIGYLLMKKK